MIYRLNIEPDDNGTLLVTSQDFPPLVTYGEDKASAIANAKDAVETLIESMMSAREDIPLPFEGDTEGKPLLFLDLQTSLKVTLYREMKASGMKPADLQRKLHWNRESVDRLFRLSHASKTEQFDAAFRALGRAVDVRAKVREVV